MKAKVLLGCFILSGGLVVSYQSQVRQIVSAETRKSISSQQETVPKVENSSTVASTTSEQPKESVKNSESSSTEEIISNEGKNSVDLTTSETDKATEKSTTETSVAEVKIPEAVVNVQAPLPAAKVEENYQFSVTKNQTTEEFIQTIGKNAQQIAWNEGLYASVMIAQAILETGSGNSQLARPPHHNLFGIKGSYQGKQVSFNTQEDTGSGQLYTIQATFRQYPSYKESLEDYAELLKKGISGNAVFYQATWKEYATTYKEATEALTGKYATDTTYDKKLNALIETYQLTMYDVEPSAEETASPIETSEASMESTGESVEQAEKKATKLSHTDEPETITSKTKQSVVIVPPVTQRPAKEVAGTRLAQ